MSISIGTDPAKAFSDLGRLEREIRSMIKRNGGKLNPSASSVSKGKRNEVRYTGNLRAKLADAIEGATRLIASDIESDSPQWSSWLVSNFKHVEGQKPVFSIIPEPAVKKRGLYSSLVEPIIGSKKIDGVKPQYIYNNVNYAEAVALGDFPGISASLDWYLSIGQYHISGGYLRKSIALSRGR